MNGISRKVFVRTLILITLSLKFVSCATASLPELTLRKLRISEDRPGFEYKYEVCIKKFLGLCTNKEMQTEYYDLTKPEVRKTLIDAGFIGVVRDKPI